MRGHRDGTVTSDMTKKAQPSGAFAIAATRQLIRPAASVAADPRATRDKTSNPSERDTPDDLDRMDDDGGRQRPGPIDIRTA